MFASYIVALTVVPLFCAKLIKGHGDASYDAAGPDGVPVYDDLPSDREKACHGHGPATPKGWAARFNAAFNDRFNRFLDWFDGVQARTLERPLLTVLSILGLFVLSLALMPFIGLAYFPRTDPGQFVVTVKAPTGTRLEMTEAEVAKVEALIRRIVPKDELGLIVSNLGVTPDFSAIYTSNSASHTAFVQASLKDGHQVGSYEYMDRVRAAMKRELPELTTYFQSGGLGRCGAQPRVARAHRHPGQRLQPGRRLRHRCTKIARRAAALPDVSDVLVPQDVDAPALKLDVDRLRVGQLGLNEKEVVDNVITALTSNAVIAPSFWIDPKTGNDYLLTVQYPEDTIKTLTDLKNIPLRSMGGKATALLDAVTKVNRVSTPTEVDHYQLRRVIDVFRRTEGRGTRRRRQRDGPHHRGRSPARGCTRDDARHRAGDARVVFLVRPRPDPGGRAGVPDPGGAVPLVRGPVPDPVGRAAGDHRGASSSWRFPARRSTSCR